MSLTFHVEQSYISSYNLMVFPSLSSSPKATVCAKTQTHASAHLNKTTPTRLVIGGRHGHLHHDHCPLHLCLGRGHQVDEPPPQVPHLHHLRGDGEALVDTRRPLQFVGTEVICLASYLDLRTAESYSLDKVHREEPQTEWQRIELKQTIPRLQHQTCVMSLSRFVYQI